MGAAAGDDEGRESLVYAPAFGRKGTFRSGYTSEGWLRAFSEQSSGLYMERIAKYTAATGVEER